MGNGKYLHDLLLSQQLSKNQKIELRNLRGHIRQILRKEFGPQLKIRVGGSYKKKTVVKSSFDIDIVVLSPHGNPLNTPDFNNAVGAFLQSKGKNPRQRKVAWEIPSAGDFHIDVVPATYHNEELTQVSLYDSKAEEVRNINLNKHINLIKESQLHQIIRLAKIWKKRRWVPIPTFFLENLVIEACKDSPNRKLEPNLRKAWVFIRDNVTTIKMTDPEIKSNIISDSITPEQKNRVKILAAEACDTTNLRQIFG